MSVVGQLIPWKILRGLGSYFLELRFRRELRLHNPADTIAYFWPEAPIRLVQFAKNRGYIVGREMINSPCLAAKSILDAAYKDRDLPIGHKITSEVALAEAEELKVYDFVFSSNDEVDRLLVEQGVSQHRIVKTAFGWSAPQSRGANKIPRSDRTRFLFLGTVEVRKGVLDLLEAWTMANLGAELVLAGHVEVAVKERIAELNDESIKQVGFVENVEELLSSADVFVFPTLEEGGPQVTYEAAAVGLPIITTSMGAARLVKHRQTGLIVQPNRPDQLCDAMIELANDKAVRRELGRRAREASAEFTYDRVARQRALAIRSSLTER